MILMPILVTAFFALQLDRGNMYVLTRQRLLHLSYPNGVIFVAETP